MLRLSLYFGFIDFQAGDYRLARPLSGPKTLGLFLNSVHQSSASAYGFSCAALSRYSWQWPKFPAPEPSQSRGSLNHWQGLLTCSSLPLFSRFLLPQRTVSRLNWTELNCRNNEDFFNIYAWLTTSFVHLNGHSLGKRLYSVTNRIMKIYR